METIQLTPAEVAMIEIKRKEEALKEEKRLLETQAYREGQIKRKVEEVGNYKHQAQLNRTAMSELYKSLLALNVETKQHSPSFTYSVRVRGEKRLFECYDYVSKGPNDVYFSLEEVVEVASIKISGTEMEIVHDSIHPGKFRIYGAPYRSGGYSREKTDNLLSAKTIHEKIRSFVSYKESKATAEDRQKKGVEFLKKTLAEKYPDAEIKPVGYNENSSEYFVRLKNKLEINYTFNFTEKEGEMILKLQTINIANMSMKDRINAVELLSNL